MQHTGLRWARVPPDIVDIPTCLTSGQAFRWLRGRSGDWLGAAGATAMRLRPGADGFWWQTYPEADRWDVIARYFALDVDLASLHGGWSRAEPWIAPALRQRSGLRVLRQEPEEALFAFACACCNTVVKIGRSVRGLSRRYGSPLAGIDGETVYGFPDAVRLAAADEAELRCDLWGFRAPRLIALARHAAARGPGWLAELCRMPYPAARHELMAAPGIGAKIADCVCLFGLGHNEAVPVDTHIRQVSARRFGVPGGGRTLTRAAYDQVADTWRQRFGSYAGWAQQYAFVGELPASRGGVDSDG